MKKTLIFLAVLLFAFDAKVEPYEVYKIKSSVSGSVKESHTNYESKEVKDTLVIKIDDYKDRINLKNINEQIKILKNEIANQSQIVARKRNMYLRYRNLKTKSLEQKNLKFYDYANALNQLYNLKSQLSNFEYQRKSTIDTINKKNVKLSGYVYKIYVNKGDYVNPGTLLAEIDDISKEKLTIYVPINKIDEIKNKEIYINGKKSGFKIEKIWNVPDSKYVTSYRVDLVGSGLKLGDIVKVEFR